MRFIFLGTGGSTPTPLRHTSSVYFPDHGLLLDAGTNTFRLRELHGEGPLTVLMSHFHLDHSIGLFSIPAGMFHGRSAPEVTVYGPSDGPKFTELWGPEHGLFPLDFPFRFQPAPNEFRVGDVRVQTLGVPHSAPVFAYRLTFPDGTSVGWVTDTTAPGDYTEFVRGVDVLIHECTFSTRNREWARVTGHSEPGGVAEVASAAEVGALYLTHIGPLEDAQEIASEVRSGFPNTILPVEGLCYPAVAPVDPRRAVFPGSFDPLTVSHMDIAATCAEMFDEVHVVIARNPAKDATALFTPDERVDLIRECLPPGIKVAVWGGLTVDYARAVQAGRVVRGLGRAEDYTVEVRLWKTNALLAPEMQTVWVPPRAENLEVSSSMVKEAGMFGGWDRVKHLVPERIRDRVGDRVNARRRV